MNILLSAAALSPYQGSEPGVGWTVASGYATFGHKVTAMVYDFWREELERADKEGLVPENLVFVYIPVTPMPKGSPLKLKFWTWKIYKEYTKQVRAIAIDLLKQEKFDFIQHVTIATWRVPVPLYNLGIPFIFGPVGGGEKMPWSMLAGLSIKAKIFEIIRMLDNSRVLFNISWKKFIRYPDAVVLGNEDTKKIISKYRSRDVYHQCVVSLQENHIERFQYQKRPFHKRLIAFYGGLVEGRKGIVYAIRAIALARQFGTEIEYHIHAHGSEVDKLKSEVVKYGVADLVSFYDKALQGEHYVKMLQNSDIFLMPTLRDNCSITLIESMLTGCVPIVADSGGPSEIVSNGKDGFCCSVKSPRILVREIAEKLIFLSNNRKELEAFSKEASKSRKSKSSFDSYMRSIIEIKNMVNRSVK